MVYLNNTATSFPKPKEVIDAVNLSLSTPPIHSSRAGFEREIEEVDYACRCNLAKLFNVKDPYRIVFSSGSTESLNLAINGLNLDNCNVVSTKIEHNSVIRPLKTLEKQGMITATFVDCDSTGYVSPSAIEQAIQKDTKAIVVNHSSNVTGSVLDIKEISKIAHKNDCYFIVDASQSAGTLPIDIEGWDIDLLAFTGHKSLFGMPGTGGLYIKEGIDLKPLKVGGTGILSEVLTQPTIMPLYYEAGTPNAPGIASLNAGVAFVLKQGIDNIRMHKADIVKRIIEEFKSHPKIKIYTSYENNSLANFCFNIIGMVPEEVGYMMENSYEIIIRSGLHCAPLILDALDVQPWGTVRVSPSFFTTDEEVDYFIKSLYEICDFVK